MDIDTKKIDFERAAMLLNLIEKQSTVAPRATHISSAAHSELMALNDSIKAAAIEAEKERRAAEHRDQHEMLEPDAPNPNEPDPDEDLKNDLKPSVFPSDSNTATIADANIDRRL